MIEITQIQYVIAASSCGSFRRAAETFSVRQYMMLDYLIDLTALEGMAAVAPVADLWSYDDPRAL